MRRARPSLGPRQVDQLVIVVLAPFTLSWPVIFSVIFLVFLMRSRPGARERVCSSLLLFRFCMVFMERVTVLGGRVLRRPAHSPPASAGSLRCPSCSASSASVTRKQILDFTSPHLYAFLSSVSKASPLFSNSRDTVIFKVFLVIFSEVSVQISSCLKFS